MSVAHITWAFAQDVGSGTRKVVLLALADRCNKDTLVCRPKIATIAKDCCLSERAVRLALDYLCDEAKILSRERRRGTDGTLRGYDYRFPPVAVRAEPAAPGAASPVARGAAHEPEVTPEPKTLAAAPRVSRNHPMWDPIWQALDAGFGPVTTRDAQGRRAKAVKALVEAGATPDEIFARGNRWKRHFPGATFTQEALVKWWDTLPRKELR